MQTKPMNQLLSTAKSELSAKTARLKTLKKSSESKKEESGGFVQDFIPIEDFQHGMIFMKDGSILKILEIIPINYDEREPHEKDMIADTFGIRFKTFPVKGHIKAMNTQTDLDNFERSIRHAVKDETDEGFLARVEDYITNSKKLQKSNSIKKRFFFTFEYEGDEAGKKSDNINDIYFSMMQMQHSITTAFRGMGHAVLNTDTEDMPLVEILYDFFNPKSRETSPLSDRINHIRRASEDMYAATGKSVVAPASDYVAPRGIRMGKWNYMVMDGVYHMYFCLANQSYPKFTYAGWLDRFFKAVPDCDIDIIYKKSMFEGTEFLLDRYDVINKGLAHTMGDDVKKREEHNTKANNAAFIKEMIQKHDEELYDVCTIITLRADSYKELMFKRATFVKEMKTNSFAFEESFMQTQELFKMTMPFNYVNTEIFNSCKRNMTNSSLSSLYFFSSYEMFDEDGDIMGTTVNSNTLLSINNFNTKKFANPHIFLAGTSGAGKTFTEQMLASRMRMRGVRTMFILPLKGHEYKDNVESLGGSFISLRPGGQNRINIMEIRPEGKAIMSEVDDEEIAQELEKGPSLLAKKINSVTTWVRMLLGDEKLSIEEASELNTCLMKVYNRFGITDDNKSIWADAEMTKLKVMPIIEDVYNEVAEIPLLARVKSVLKVWVSGNCSNMNGQTNVNLDNMTLAFDINEDYIGEELLAAFMYIAFDVCYAIAKRDEYEMCAIILDEIWKMLVIEACAKQIFKMIKILRAYGTCAITATQDIEDCTTSEWGRAIISNSAIKIFLKVTKDEIRALGDAIDLSPENKTIIQKVPTGVGFICFNTERILVNFQASLWEEEIYTTDINKKREIRNRRTQQSLR